MGFASAMLCVIACLLSLLTPVPMVVRLFGFVITAVAIAAIALAPTHEFGALLAVALWLASLSIILQCLLAIPKVSKALNKWSSGKLQEIQRRMGTSRARK